MAVITISTESRAGGRRVGRELATRLGYDYLDKEILHSVALAVKVPSEDVEEYEEENHDRFKSFLSNLFDLDALKGKVNDEAPKEPEGGYDDRDHIPFEFTVDGWIDSDIYRQMVHKTITALGRRGNAVLVGRGSQVILAEHPDAIHLRFVADFEDRVGWTARDLKMAEDEARRYLRDRDARSCRYLEFYFDLDPDNSARYHVILNTSLVKRARCADLVMGLVPEGESGQASTSPPETELRGLRATSTPDRR